MWIASFETPRPGLEPGTYRLTAGCSTIELSRIMIARTEAIIPRRRTARKGERPENAKKESPGNDLLLHAVARTLPSALTSLTAGFGMGPGVSSSLKSPRDSFKRRLRSAAITL